MAMKECCSSGKIPHQTREAAEAHARSIQQKDGHLPHIYVCKECGFLHIGGGRKSDRPAWLQAHSGPVLPPDKLPRKSYERRQVDKGQSVSLEEAISDYFLKNPLATDEKAGKHFGMTQSQMWWLRSKLGISVRLKRLDKLILVALKKDPGTHRGQLCKQLGISYFVLTERIRKLGFAGTGTYARRGVHHHLFGKRASTDRKAQLRESSRKAWSSPEYRAKVSQKHKIWAQTHRDELLKTLNPGFRNLSPEARRRQAESLRRFYANLTPEEKKARIQKAVAGMTPEARKKISDSKRKLYGSMTPEERKAWFASSRNREE